MHGTTACYCYCCCRLAQYVAVAGASLSAQTAELTSLRDQLAAARTEAAEGRAALAEAQRTAASAGEGLAVEKQLRARAELREEQERRGSTAGMLTRFMKFPTTTVIIVTICTVDLVPCTIHTRGLVISCSLVVNGGVASSLYVILYQVH